MSAQPFRDALRFVGALVRSPRNVGAVLPSSPHLARALAGDLGLEPGDVVVEYGPGTGPMTAVIEKQLTGGIEYVGIERDPGFHARLQARFPKLRFHLGSVEQVEEVLAEHGLGRPRYVISGLPFASLPEEVQVRVADATRKVLRDTGEFRTFQYVHAYGLSSARRFREDMARRFGSFARSKPVLLNVPPAYVLTYRP